MAFHMFREKERGGRKVVGQVKTRTCFMRLKGCSTKKFPAPTWSKDPTSGPGKQKNDDSPALSHYHIPLKPKVTTATHFEDLEPQK